MTDRDALLAAVRERPFDPIPRQVFADWLQENGEEAHAALLRLSAKVQAALERITEPPLEATPEELDRARQALDSHTDGEALMRLAGVWCWRRHFVGITPMEGMVRVLWLQALGLAESPEQENDPEHTTLYAGPGSLLSRLLLAENPGEGLRSVSELTSEIDSSAAGYQLAVCEALALATS